jgi:O-antigen/teichoic acid export membrane protein
MIAQIINFGFSPVLTRIYTPSQFGLLTTMTAVVSILIIISTLQLEWSIPLSKDDQNNVESLSVVIIVHFILSILISFVAALFISAIIDKENNLNWFLWFVIVWLFVLLMGLFLIYTQQLFYKLDFKTISYSKIVLATVQNASMVILGVLSIHYGLIFGRIFGYLVSVMVIMFTINALRLRTSVSLNLIKNQVLEKKKFIFFQVPSRILNVLGLYLPIIVLSVFFDTEITGFYGLANTVVGVPIVLFGNSIGEAFYGRISKMGLEKVNDIYLMSKRITLKLFFISLVPFIVFYITSPFLFQFLFGDGWIQAGYFARYLSLMMLFRLVFTPTTRVFPLLNKQNVELYMNALRVVIVSVCFLLGIFIWNSASISIVLYSISMMIVYGLTYAASLFEIKKRTERY